MEFHISWLPTERCCSCPPQALNCLSQHEWLKYQIPIWYVPREQRKTPFDIYSRLHHPAVFPTALARRVVKLYTHRGETVLDPFSGVGTLLYACLLEGRNAIGIELNKQYVEIVRRRFALRSCSARIFENVQVRKNDVEIPHIVQIWDDARKLKSYIPAESIDLVFTSPPYWDMLKQAPSRVNKALRQYLKSNYSENSADLSNAADVVSFLEALRAILGHVVEVLKPGKRCVINTGDYRRRGQYIPLHNLYINLARRLRLKLKNIILWDRRREYRHNIFSYPHSFIVNNGMCEYLLEFYKLPG